MTRYRCGSVLCWMLRILAFPLLLTLADFKAPTIVVDLDVDPAHRWDAAMLEYKHHFAALASALTSRPSVKQLLPKIESAAALGNHWFTTEQYAELQGISRVSQVSLPVVILASMLYDLTATKPGLPNHFGHKACTSIVVECGDGDIVHGRNLDYDSDLADPLASLTAVVEFQREGKTLFATATFIGMVGFHTAVKPGLFSITLNERDSGTVSEHLKAIFSKRRIVTMSFIRHVTEEANSYTEAVKLIQNAPIASSGYYIVGGTKGGQGVVATRSPDAEVDTWSLDVSRERWYIAETNYDRTVQPPFGDDRRHPVQRFLNATGQAGFCASPINSLQATLSNRQANRSSGERPTLNSETIFTAVMQVKSPAFINVTVRTKIMAMTPRGTSEPTESSVLVI
eukprot:TRINITY_DN61690_c0_g1_i1.p1 TRINITY_DN61690_c0_g1~~TRINITY_DN61690_c0_g1_i1.p1  ORF type:complete len:433 (-),score=53.98 TRINITY_DN61690_c0_g1_i1:86-1282(-)